MNRTRIALLITTSSLFAGCGGNLMVREAPVYRDATRQLVMSKNDGIKACYDAELKKTPTAAGVVVVEMKVQAETGKVIEPRLKEGATTAPPTVSNCVLRAVSGAVLTPADKNEGQATFRWELKPGA